MTDWHQAMTGWLGALGLPVYPEKRVPDGAAFPFIVWSGGEAAFGEKGSATVCGWHRRDYPGCLSFVDRLTAMLPEQGVLLCVGEGRALIWCEEAYIRTDEADTSVSAGCVKLGVRHYPAPEEKEATA